jgi:hypothetical protein
VRYAPANFPSATECPCGRSANVERAAAIPFAVRRPHRIFIVASLFHQAAGQRQRKLRVISDLPRQKSERATSNQIAQAIRIPLCNAFCTLELDRSSKGIADGLPQ